MRPFAYARAATLEDALHAAREPGTAVLAGGTELLNWLRLGIAAPDRVLDISHIAGLDRIEPLAGGGLRIGALVRLNDLAADERVARDWPVLREAIHKSASAQLRNLVTIGANLLQKTRCPYFRSENPVMCNRRAPGSGCAARDGHDERHALFGWTDACIATQPSDPAVALAALDAQVVTRTASGGRRIPVTDFHVLPADGVDRDSVLERGELIEAIELDRPAPRSAYVKVRERESYEYALASAAATVQLDSRGRIETARIALGSVAMRPWRLTEAEHRLAGLAPDAPAAARALDVALARARPVPGSAYKVAIARGAARRALMRAAGVRP
jgi:xanthine dehydrogenase YagS FAD-binding subunit